MLIHADPDPELDSRRREAETGLCQLLLPVLQNICHFISLSGQPAWLLAALGKQWLSLRKNWIRCRRKEIETGLLESLQMLLHRPF